MSRRRTPDIRNYSRNVDRIKDLSLAKLTAVRGSHVVSPFLDSPLWHRHPFAFILQAARTISNSLEMPSVASHAMNVLSVVFTTENFELKDSGVGEEWRREI
jgi:hypothetical protein